MSLDILSIQRRVKSFIREYGLTNAGEKILVAVSGGPDSICLLHILNALKSELDNELCVAHLDHGLRGAESEEDANYVRNLAHQLGIEVIVGKKDAGSFSKERHCSLEEAAREVRYTFLDEAASKAGTSKVAVGHTRDDQVETIIMHVLRGAGIDGLRGLRPATAIPFGAEGNRWIIRPLLKITRWETAEYCRAVGLTPRIDSSNLQKGFLRNRIRLELIPLLRQYNPEIDDILIRLSELAREDADFIEIQTDSIFNQIVSGEDDLICLDSGKLRSLPLSLQRRILRKALAKVYGSLKNIEAVHVESLVNLLFAATGKAITLPGGFLATSERTRIVVMPPETGSCPWPPIKQEYKLNIPGETSLPGWKVTSEIIGENYFREDDIFSASFDLNKTGRLLTVRGRRPGDRFHPLGMPHTRKLQDFMVDAAIPRLWRDSVPLVFSPQHLIWVVGWRIDDRVKVTTNTEQVLRIEFHRSDRV